MRHIDADALMTEIEEYRIKFPHGAEENTQNMMIDLFCNCINNAPTVEHPKAIARVGDNREITLELIRPQGEWVEGYHDGFTTHDCSICGHSKESTHLQYNFCPNCGADMRKVGGE